MKPESSPLILIADDQPDVLEALRLLLKGEGYRTQTVHSPAKLFERLNDEDFDAVLMDLNYARDTTSGKEGLEMLARIQGVDPHLPVVVMTAWASVDLAVEAMRRGARDFVRKPWDNARLLTILRNQVALGKSLRKEERLEAENRLLRGAPQPLVIADSAAMKPVLEVITRVAPSDANILITGENGTGKGVIAQALHAASTRSGKSLVTVNMGGLSEGVFESELFGHVKGAFTDAKTDRVGRFELAEGGTLFLDEIANVPLSQQTKLLRVIETGEFERVGSSKTHRADVRIVSATNADLGAEVGAGRFRQDLLFRLNTIEIHLPPLRERREDIPKLAEHFMAAHRQHYRKQISGFGADALEMLIDYSWPGNVRELDHVVERSVLMANKEIIHPADLGLQRSGLSAPRLEDMDLEEVEKFLIQKTLARFQGNAKRAAEALGLSRSAFYRRLQRHGL